MALGLLEDLRSEFARTLDSDVKSLIKLYEADVKTAGRPANWLRAVKRSSVVLVAANLENFIEDCVCKGLEHLVENRVRATSYSEEFRMWRFRKDAHMRNLGIENSRELVKLSLKLFSEVYKLQRDELMLDQIRAQFANPTPSNINWIMGLLDWKDYVAGATLRMDGAEVPVEATLHELANRRNSVAHGDATQDPSIEDVKRLAKFARQFSTRIKKDASSKVERCL